MAIIMQDYGSVGASSNVVSGEMPITANTNTTISTGITNNKLKRFVVFLDMTDHPTAQEYMVWDNKEPTYYSGYGYDGIGFRYTLNDIRYWGGIISVDTTTGDVVIKAGTNAGGGNITWIAEKAS